MLWFKPLLDASGSSLHVAVAMAAPLCDLVLLVLLVAGLAPQRYRPTWSSALLMAGASCFVAGNVVYLNHRSGSRLRAANVSGRDVGARNLLHCSRGVAERRPPREITRGLEYLAAGHRARSGRVRARVAGGPRRFIVPVHFG